MNALPLPKELFDRAVATGVKTIALNFSGGSDEGYLYVSTDPCDSDLEDAIQEWADEAYEYSGAGDGTDYGDDIVYDLVEKTVSTQEWFTKRADGESTSTPMDDLVTQTQEED